MNTALLTMLLLISGQKTMPNRDVERAMDILWAQLESLIVQYNQKKPVKDLSILEPTLARLEAAVDRNAHVRVSRATLTTLRLEGKSALLFRQPPVLPPEVKSGGRWHFSTIRLEAVPRHLFLYSLTFKGDHTIRLRKVTLYFRDGTSMAHDRWWHMESDNGKAFSRRDFLPPLDVGPAGQPRRARVLEAIEIVGSAQDGPSEARLEFLLEVPDPEERPYREARDMIARLRKKWTFKTLNAARLNQCTGDLTRLADALELDAHSGTVARE